MSQLVVVDFDGTVTDVEAEGMPFRDGYLDDLAALTGRDPAETRAMAKGFEVEILAEPQSFGWLWKGQIVCPATVDPYQRMRAVAEKLLDACGVFKPKDERERLLDLLFRHNYGRSDCSFRPFAAEVLSALQRFDTWIVTNVHVEPIKAKLDRLDGQWRLRGRGSLGWLGSRIVGQAMKHAVEDGENDLPRELRLPRLARPVLVRRPHYRKVLEGLRAERSWSDVTVVGDIFELDLSLPLSLGANVILVCNDFTPSWERDFVRAHNRGRVVEDLREVPEIVGRLG